MVAIQTYACIYVAHIMQMIIVLAHEGSYNYYYSNRIVYIHNILGIKSQWYS